MPTVKWTPEHSDTLRDLVVSNKMSYSSIAAKLNEQFGTSYSRNAAIGRAGRMGLINPFKVKVYRAERPVPVRSRPKLTIIQNGPKSSRLFMSSENAAEVKICCIEIVPRNLSLIDLEPNDCRYPYGENVITFCGHPKQEGSSYCTPHHALTSHMPTANFGKERPDSSGRSARAFLGGSRNVLTKFDGEDAA
jgi:GcrA cell cycle regulator